MGVSLNLNLSCAQPGEVDFPNLTTARSLLTLVESCAANFYVARWSFDANSSSNAFASFRSRVSNPSLNQP